MMEDYKGELWGKAFAWQIKGASVEEVWAVTGNFLEVDKWATSLVKSCELVKGEPQMPGCVRKVVLFPTAPGEPFTIALEKLTEMDVLQHCYSYTMLEGSTMPGFSLMQDYNSTFKLSSPVDDRPRNQGGTSSATLLHWSFVCRPISTLSKEQSQQIAFSLYQAAVDELKARLSLPTDSISLLSNVE
ncbi:hypothetical protein L7F22_033372 [Adiantum nelumboides]|nr:hypothetical protein [Adiantum nelumboides]